ncbi:cytochrome b [Rhodobacter viridis]|uniref:Cytochrome b n=1 Tax=Rhodobacter viridis TaxID=1054202 RepID=A0A318TYA7_9RHOB|nr:cytochrome b/b6 domain-containing protein [Rhodobacter viridis]PYF09747.1 cytochrome b [Rhodobacter viridis]
MTDMTDSPATSRPMIWDPLVRVFHWALFLCVVSAWLLGEFGPDIMTLHFWIGYAVGGLLLIRLLWGFVGTRTARFANFVTGPGAVLRYAMTLPARKPSHTPGHNPLGGWSVVAMIGVLGLQVVTGLFSASVDDFVFGPFSDLVSEDVNKLMLDLHKSLAPVILALVALHVGAIWFYKIWKREDLVTPMITGRRRG